MILSIFGYSVNWVQIGIAVAAVVALAWYYFGGSIKSLLPTSLAAKPDPVLTKVQWIQQGLVIFANNPQALSLLKPFQACVFDADKPVVPPAAPVKGA